MEVNSENNKTLIFLEFSGGLDSLILNQERELELKIHSNEINLGQLIAYIRKYIIGSKKDYFSFTPELNNNNNNSNKLEDNNSNLNVLDNKVKVECNIDLFNGSLNYNETCKIRPGVLVLVNDVDWELLEKEKTVLKNNHKVTFISTLHEMLTLPKGGGPCPLINNLFIGKLRGLAIAHFVIVGLTVAAVSGSAALDLHCAPLFSTLPHSILSAIGSIITSIFYLRISSKQLGTEVEFSITSLVSISLAVIDIGISCWGFYSLENAASKIYKAFKNELQIEPECLQTIAIIYLFSSFLILLLHIIVSGACFIVSLMLSKGIKKQLLDMRMLS